ncbi:MAG: alkanesulfonate monooxygenase SsuD [Bradymonadia bacterium]
MAADTEARAQELAKSAEAWFVRTFVRGGVSAFPTNSEAEAETYDAMEQALIGMRRQFSAVGTGPQVAEKLRALVAKFQIDELSIVTLTAEHADRVRSYELLADALI